MWGRVITMDFDKGSELRQRAVRAYQYFERNADAVEIRISSSGEGLHIIGKYDALLDDETMVRIRNQLEDDTHRIQMDEQRIEHDLPAQVLWDDKHGRDGTADRDFTDLWSALEMIDAGVDDHDAIHGWAQHGHKSREYHAAQRHAQQLTHEK